MGAASPTRTKAPAKRAAAKAAPAPANANVIHPDLASFYDPPALTTARGAGTTGGEGILDLNFDTSQPIPEMPMEPLFSIDGKTYFIPVEFPPAYSIVYLDALDQGRDVAIGKALKLAVGPGWKALKDLAEARPDLITPHHLQTIMTVVQRKIMGTLEENGEGNG